MNTNKKPSTSKIDKYLAIAGIISGAVLIGYLALLQKGAVYYLPILFTLISCIIWLAIRKKGIITIDEHPETPRTIVFSSLYFLIFSFSLLILHERPLIYERPLIFFIFAALLTGILFFEIMYSGGHYQGLILIQIILAGILFSWSQLLIFPHLIGIDPFYHEMFTTQIVSTSHIPLGESYTHLPVFHLLIAQTAMLTGLEYKLAALFSVNLLQIILNVLFTFLLGMTILNHRKTALMASLFVAIANFQIRMSVWSIPNSLAAVLLLAILFLVLTIQQKKARTTLPLLYFLMIVLIITHTVTALAVAIILILFELSFPIFNRFHQKKEYNFLPGISVRFTVVMLAWWIYASKSIYSLANLIKAGFSVHYFVTAQEDVLRYSSSIPVWEQVCNNIGFCIFFALSFIGIFYLISRKEIKSNYFAVAGFSLLFIGFVSQLSGFEVIQSRWYYLSQVLLALPLAIGITALWLQKKRGSRKRGILLFIGLALFTFFLIISPPANNDNHQFSPQSGITYSLTASEIQSFEMLSGCCNKTVATDYLYTVSQHYSGYRVRSYDEEIYHRNFQNLTPNLVLVRGQTIDKPSLVFFGPFQIDYPVNEQLSENRFSRIYHSGTVEGYGYLW